LFKHWPVFLRKRLHSDETVTAAGLERGWLWVKQGEIAVPFDIFFRCRAAV
jgi:hypothetical protein